MRTRTWSKVGPILGLLVSLATVGCSSGADNGTQASPTTPSPTVTTPATTTVNATEKEFSISLDQPTVPAGAVHFAITNGGQTTHEFVVIRTDIPDGQLPRKHGEANEDAKGLTGVDEREDIAAGTTATLDVRLDPGTYVIICNIADHYQEGMHVGLTVS